MTEINRLPPATFGVVEVRLPLLDGNQVTIMAPSKLTEEAWAQLMTLLDTLKPSITIEYRPVFRVVVQDVGARKISMIKETRHFHQLGLREAKDFVEKDLPGNFMTGLTELKARKMTDQLIEAGSIARFEREDALEDLV